MTPNIAIVGYGYWGPNLLRTFVNLSSCTVRYCCDLDIGKLQEAKRRFPHVEITNDFNKVISDSNVDAVVLAVPTKLHFALAKRAIEAGKDVLVEKPMTSTSKEARQLVVLAKRKERILMVDHILLFNPAVLKIKELIDKGEIGEILYIDSARTNLGLFRKDVNVIFDLAAHEFSIIQFLLGKMPKVVNTEGKAHVDKQIDIAYITARYPKNIFAHVHVTWLSPLKIRRMIIVGSKKMIIYDDNDVLEKVKVYDKGIVKEKTSEANSQIKIGYRVGDVWSPNVEVVEPLSLLAQSFVDAISTRKVVRSDGKFGAGVVEILERANRMFNKTKVVV